MHLYKINQKNYESFFKDTIKTESTGAKLLAKKSIVHTIFIKDLHVGAGNILKQDALSIGADLAVPRGTIVAQTQYIDAVLIGTTKHLEQLSRKELAQPFGLKEVAKQLKSFLQKDIYGVEIMGIINANDDSFFNKSRFSGRKAIKQIKKQIKHGATTIDIGSVSSAPNAKLVSEEEELRRIKPICDAIKSEKLYKKVKFSCDSYTPSVVEYALNCGFTIVNDITGLKSDKIAKLVAKYDATVVIMHMKGAPKDMQNNPEYNDVMIEVDEFFKKRIEKAKRFGIEKIMIDIGIGFGKTLKHNIELLKNLSHFKHFGYPLLIGASRKSMIDKITPSTPNKRLPGTLAIHLEAINQGVNIIRCHDVKEHFQAIEIQKRLI